MTPDEIKQLRQSLGLSQQKFADALRTIDPLLGVDRQTVYRWEIGKQSPNAHSALAIAKMRQRTTAPGPTPRKAIRAIQDADYYVVTDYQSVDDVPSIGIVPRKEGRG